MPDLDFASLAPRATHFLDVSPMTSALHFQPTDFEYSHGRLRHVPSRHRFQFSPTGEVRIDAVCGCAGAAIRQEQADELLAAFQTWRQSYWQPLQMNREFASHFRKPSSWIRLFRDIRMAWRRFLGPSKPIGLKAAELSPVTAK